MANKVRPLAAKSNPASDPLKEVCPHRHFKFDTIDRDILSRKQHWNLLCTPKGYRWMIMKPNHSRMKSVDGALSPCKLRKKKPGHTYVNNILAELWDFVTPEMGQRMKEMLMAEFGLSAEAALDFLCHSRFETCLIADNVQREMNDKLESSKNDQPPEGPIPCVAAAHECKGDMKTGIRPVHVRKFSKAVSSKCAEYATAMLCAKRGFKQRTLAAAILKGLCDLTGEQTTMDDPKNRLHKILTFTSDRLALWLAGEMVDEDKIRANQRKKEDKALMKKQRVKQREMRARQKEKEKIYKAIERNKRRRVREEAKENKLADERKQKRAENEKRHQDLEKFREEEKKEHKAEVNKANDKTRTTRGNGEPAGGNLSKLRGPKAVQQLSGGGTQANVIGPKQTQSGRINQNAGNRSKPRVPRLLQDSDRSTKEPGSKDQPTEGRDGLGAGGAYQNRSSSKTGASSNLSYASQSTTDLEKKFESTSVKGWVPPRTVSENSDPEKKAESISVKGRVPSRTVSENSDPDKKAESTSVKGWVPPRTVSENSDPEKKVERISVKGRVPSRTVSETSDPDKKGESTSVKGWVPPRTVSETSDPDKKAESTSVKEWVPPRTLSDKSDPEKEVESASVKGLAPSRTASENSDPEKKVENAYVKGWVPSRMDSENSDPEKKVENAYVKGWVPSRMDSENSDPDKKVESTSVKGWVPSRTVSENSDPENEIENASVKGWAPSRTASENSDPEKKVESAYVKGWVTSRMVSRKYSERLTSPLTARTELEAVSQSRSLDEIVDSLTFMATSKLKGVSKPADAARALQGGDFDQTADDHVAATAGAPKGRGPDHTADAASAMDVHWRLRTSAIMSVTEIAPVTYEVHRISYDEAKQKISLMKRMSKAKSLPPSRPFNPEDPESWTEWVEYLSHTQDSPAAGSNRLQKAPEDVNVRATGPNNYEVHSVSYNEVKLNVETVRNTTTGGIIPPQAPLDPKDPKSWTQWIEYAAKMSEEWGRWIDKTLQDTQDKAILCQAKAKEGKTDPQDVEDWNTFVRRTNEGALRFRRLRKTISDAAKEWKYR